MSSLPNNIRPIFCINPRDHIVRCLSGVKKNSQSPLIENFFLVLYLMDLLISNHFPALYNFCPGSYGPAAPTPGLLLFTLCTHNCTSRPQGRIVLPSDRCVVVYSTQFASLPLTSDPPYVNISNPGTRVWMPSNP